MLGRNRDKEKTQAVWASYKGLLEKLETMNSQLSESRPRDSVDHAIWFGQKKQLRAILREYRRDIEKLNEELKRINK